MPFCFENFRGLPAKSDGFSFEFASVAENVDLSCGRLDPWRTPCLIAELPVCTDAVFIKNGKVRYAKQKGTHVVDSLSGLCFSADPCDCLYYRKDWCTHEKHALGLPRPPTPFLDNLEAPPTDEDCWQPELTSAKITFMSRCGHHKFESQPSVISNDVKAMVEDQLCIEIPAFDPGKYTIDTVCIYLSYTTWDVAQGLHGYPALGRNLQGRAPEDVATNFETNADIDCYKVAEVAFNPNGMKVFLEKDKCFGPVLRTKGWRAPDPGWCMAGESNTGSLVAYDENCLYYSVRNHPEAWPMYNIMNFGSRIRYACHKGLFTYVFTEDCELFIVTDDNDCTTKESCRSVRRICDVPKPCISKFNANKATLCGEYGVVYPSEEGVIHVRPDGSINNVLPTDKRKFAWRYDISMARYRGMLFISGFEETYVMGFPALGASSDRPSTLSSLSFHVKCWVETCDGLHFLDCDGKLYKWDSGDECLPMRYRNNIIRIQGLNLTTLSIEYADGDNVPMGNTVTLFKDGSPFQVKCLNTCDPTRMRRLSNAKTFTYEYNGTESVQRICIGTSLQDLGAAQAA